MVAARHLSLDEGLFKARAERGADKEVIDAPADVPGAGIGKRSPPGVLCAPVNVFNDNLYTSTYLDIFAFLL